MTKKKKSRAMPTYFFYKGDLHRRIHINRGADLITCWHFKSGKPVKYSYSDVRKNGKKAFTTGEVGRLVHRRHWAVKDAMNSGFFEKPERSYGLDENRNPYKYMWSEKNIMDLHECLSQIHIGRPRKDGEITAGRGLPTARELRAMIRSGHQYYIQDADGEFVPTWERDSI